MAYDQNVINEHSLKAEKREFSLFIATPFCHQAADMIKDYFVRLSVVSCDSISAKCQAPSENSDIPLFWNLQGEEL